jgi:hypothetical protein
MANGRADTCRSLAHSLAGPMVDPDSSLRCAAVKKILLRAISLCAIKNLTQL